MTSPSKRVKRSAAVLVRRHGTLLALRRADDDDELPGVWGLPAGTYRGAEDRAALVRRIGHDKLGARLEPGGVLATGRQQRPAYTLDMELVEARLEGDPKLGDWQWAPEGILEPGRDRGSLCCRLALDFITGS